MDVLKKLLDVFCDWIYNWNIILVVDDYSFNSFLPSSSTGDKENYGLRFGGTG